MWLLAVFVVLANAPDLPCPAWGHERYEISHSLLVTTIGVACLEIFLLWKSQAWPAITLPVAVGMGMTWYSHLLLDTFYNHGKGLAIYWPWSDARLALPIPWFDNLEPVPVISWHNASVCAVEATVYGGLLVLVLGVRGIVSRRGG